MGFWAVLATFVVAIWTLVWIIRLFRRITVFEYQHGLRFRHGRLAGAVAAGSYWIYRPWTRIEIVEARPRLVTVPGQEILSEDGVTLKVSLLLEFKVVDARQAFLGAEDYEAALYAAAQSVLRTAVGERKIDTVLESRAELGERLRAEVEPRAAELGLELISIAVKDIMFPGALKDAFSQAARARQESVAALERARGEQASLRSLANAARLLEKNPNLFRLRLLQAAEGGQVVLKIESPEDVADGGAPGDAS